MRDSRGAGGAQQSDESRTGHQWPLGMGQTGQNFAQRSGWRGHHHCSSIGMRCVIPNRFVSLRCCVSFRVFCSGFVAFDWQTFPHKKVSASSARRKLSCRRCREGQHLLEVELETVHPNSNDMKNETECGISQCCLHVSIVTWQRRGPGYSEPRDHWFNQKGKTMLQRKSSDFGKNFPAVFLEAVRTKMQTKAPFQKFLSTHANIFQLVLNSHFVKKRFFFIFLGLSVHFSLEHLAKMKTQHRGSAQNKGASNYFWVLGWLQLENVACIKGANSLSRIGEGSAGEQGKENFKECVWSSENCKLEILSLLHTVHHSVLGLFFANNVLTYPRNITLRSYMWKIQNTKKKASKMVSRRFRKIKEENPFLSF